MCAWFQLPKNITCITEYDLPHLNLSCLTNFPSKSKSLRIEYEVKCLTTAALLAKFHGENGIARAVNMRDIPFQLLGVYEQLGEEYKQRILNHQNRIDNLSSTYYTVVHWRRGDQLTTRCKAGQDRSVNCQGAKELIERTRKSSNDSLVYVATNEDQYSDEARRLREGGFLTFLSLNNSINSKSSISTSISAGVSLLAGEVLAIDVYLMLDASTFLGWGISEVNDVIENTRMRRGKSYCMGQEGLNLKNSRTWCLSRSNQ